MRSIACLISRGVALCRTLAQAWIERESSSRSEIDGEQLRRQADWLHRWSSRALERLHIDIEITGTTPEAGVVVANHVSYLDVLLIAASTRCIFVCKSEVRHWPVLGALANASGAIFIDRSRRHDVMGVANKIEGVLNSGVTVVVFPEGTSSDGTGVLPFHSSLLEPATSLQLPVTPAAVSYAVEARPFSPEAAYCGDATLIPHMIRLFSKRRIVGRVNFSNLPATFTDRKEAASKSHAEVSRLLRCEPIQR